MYLHTKYTEAFPLDYLLNSLKKELYLDLFIFPYVIIPITVKHLFDGSIQYFFIFCKGISKVQLYVGLVHVQKGKIVKVPILLSLFYLWALNPQESSNNEYYYPLL